MGTGTLRPIYARHQSVVNATGTPRGLCTREPTCGHIIYSNIHTQAHILTPAHKHTNARTHVRTTGTFCGLCTREPTCAHIMHSNIHTQAHTNTRMHTHINIFTHTHSCVRARAHNKHSYNIMSAVPYAQGRQTIFCKLNSFYMYNKSLNCLFPSVSASAPSSPSAS